MSRKLFKTIDEYIHTFPAPVQVILEKLRQTIKQSAPNAVETISYGIPTFKLHGNLVHFAAYKHHIGFYPIPYKNAKGTVQFPIEKPIPFDLIKRMVEFRVKEIIN